jgi:protein SCO1/2
LADVAQVVRVNSQARLIQWVVWGFLALVVASVAGVFVSTILRAPAQPLPIYGELPEFALTNQFGQTVSLASLKGDVWVADIIFTRCPGPCRNMTRKVKAIQDALPANSRAKLVSLTADPAFDTPTVLKTYATQFKADPDRWEFLTGPKQAVYDLAIKGLKLAVQENNTTNIDEMFIHSTRLVLIDGRGRLRGVASTEGADGETVRNILRGVEHLERENTP